MQRIELSKPIDIAAIEDAKIWTVDEDVVAVFSASRRALHLLDVDTHLPILRGVIKVGDEREAEAAIRRHFPDFVA